MRTTNKQDKRAYMPPNIEGIPEALRKSARFCVWKTEERDGRLTKVPKNPRTGGGVMVNVPSTFSTFDVAVMTYRASQEKPEPFLGIGIGVTNDLVVIDIDHCVEPNGSISDFAQDVLDIVGDSYIEFSPSGTGLHIFGRAPGFTFDKARYYLKKSELGLEVYVAGATNRFMTVTGQAFLLPGGATDAAQLSAFPDIAPSLQELLDEYMLRPPQQQQKPVKPHSYLSDESVMAKAGSGKQGAKFTQLYTGDFSAYGSHSEADLALASILAFWCGCDVEQMDRLFRESGLMREKWDRSQSGSTYGELTLQKAAASCTDSYNPLGFGYGSPDAEDEFDEVKDEKEPDSQYSPDTTDATDTPNSNEQPSKPTTPFDGGRLLTTAAQKKRDAVLVDFTPAYSALTVRLTDLNPLDGSKYPTTDMGFGQLFADYYKPIARYCPERKLWFVYDGIVWRADEGDMRISEMAKRVIRRLHHFGVQIQNEKSREAYLETVKKRQARRGRDMMIKDAQSVYPVSFRAFDRHPFLFNLNNGTLDLQTMEFREHRPGDMLTKVAGLNYDPNAACPRWNSYVSEVMQNDNDCARYIQKALGYSLSGDTSLECLFILYGATSRNGKGTMMETYLTIQGDYGRTANPDMLATKFNYSGSSSGPSEDVARLAGSRFINIAEPDKRITLNSALTKRLTGNDTITARYLNENSIEFRPSFKIFINTNHLPNITDMTLFQSGRIKIIPFNRHFEEEEQDKGLKKLFREPTNLSAIFNWILDGYVMYTLEGLEMPKSVIEATSEYNRESDRFGQFADECLVEDERLEVRTSAVYQVYQRWCNDNGYKPESVKGLYQSLSTKYTIVRKRPADKSGSVTSILIGAALEQGDDLVTDKG
ncbi:MAG: phage/plasmid primase, P4 family [Synergistaceae bacterium]|nr:phage/plasmid primase, P4 family [Synergistaceae bacterium]